MQMDPLLFGEIVYRLFNVPACKTRLLTNARGLQ